MGVRDAFGGDPLGFESMGSALPFCPGPFRAFRRQAAWCHKRYPTFADALALVRKELWDQEKLTFCGSPAQTDTIKVPRAYVERLTDAVCYAA